MFQESFKYYKARDPPPSFENVIDTDKDGAGLDCRLQVNNHGMFEYDVMCARNHVSNSVIRTCQDVRVEHS